MPQAAFSKKALLVVASVAVLGLGVAAFLLLRKPAPIPDGPGEEEPAATDFRECAAACGLRFQMNFLPNEQGEKFKINLYDHGCGVAIGDFDGDGWDDVYFLNQLGPNALYRNKGDGTFEDVTKKAGVALGDRVCVGATFADYTNEGRQSLFVTSTRGGNVLFRNVGNGKFVDVTEEAGLKRLVTDHSQTAVFFDFDNDGYLDLFVTNTARWTLNTYDSASHYYPGLPDFWLMAQSPREHNVLYRNVPIDPKDPKKGRRFVDVTAEAGLAGPGWGGDVTVFDYNEDGHLDLLVTNMLN